MKTNSHLRSAGCLFLLGSWLLADVARAASLAAELPPSILLIGNGQVITNGDLAPSLTDHTHFGSTVVDAPIVRSFTITNTGFGSLLLTGTPLVAVSGANPDRFAVTSPPDFFVPGGGSTTFQVTFTPDGFGPRNAILSIASNDSENPSYTFRILAVVPTGCISNITVVNNKDSGPGSLRQACLELCAGGTIDFTNTMRGQTIVLTNGEIFIGRALTLIGLGAPNLTISGNGNSRVFQIANGGGNCVLDGLTIANGSSLSEGGGGVFNRGTLILQNCALTGNRAGSGGAIANLDLGRGVFINGCTFASNSAGAGGAIYNGFRGVVAVTNSTLSANLAVNGGGGIYNDQVGTLTLSHCTLSGNAALGGGGIVNFDGAMTIGHTLVSKGTNGINFRTDGGSVSNLGFNLSDDDSGTTFFIPNAGNLLLGPLANNGGPTLTHALLPGSPAIDAGTNMAPADLLYDQRGPGFRRFVNGRMDIGAYELQAPLAFIQANWEAQGFRFVVRGEPNETLQIQWNAQLGTAGWNSLTFGSTDGAGLLQFTDTETNGDSRRFYRAVRP